MAGDGGTRGLEARGSLAGAGVVAAMTLGANSTRSMNAAPRQAQGQSNTFAPCPVSRMLSARMSACSGRVAGRVIGSGCLQWPCQPDLALAQISICARSPDLASPSTLIWLQVGGVRRREFRSDPAPRRCAVVSLPWPAMWLVSARRSARSVSSWASARSARARDQPPTRPHPTANSRHPPSSPKRIADLHIRWKLGRYYGYCYKE